jgi:hypothetical protein
VAIDDRLLDGLERSFYRLDQQEDEDAGGQRGQARLDRRARALQATERQPEEDGGAGDPAEQYDL